MLRRALISPPVLISLIVVLLAATLPLYVSGYVLGLLTIASSLVFMELRKGDGGAVSSYGGKKPKAAG